MQDEAFAIFLSYVTSPENGQMKLAVLLWMASKTQTKTCFTSVSEEITKINLVIHFFFSYSSNKITECFVHRGPLDGP